MYFITQKSMAWTLSYFCCDKVESNFKSDAISSKNARGLMQILPETGEWIAKEIGIKNYSDSMLFEPKYNIQMGTWYLTYLLKTFNGNIKLALAAITEAVEM